MPIPLSGRIGIYFTAFGLALTLLLAHFWGLDIVIPGVAFFPALLLIIGISLLVRTAFAQLDEKRDWATKALRVTDPGPQPRTFHLPETPDVPDLQTTRDNGVFPRRPLKRRFTGLPHFGLMATLVWFVAAGPWVLHFLLNPVSRGITVYLAKAPPQSPGNSPLIVRIKFVRHGAPELYLNSNHVSREDLGNTLRGSFKSRPDWVIYVEADPDVDWQYVADVVDISRNAHARIVLLTKPSRDDE